MSNIWREKKLDQSFTASGANAEPLPVIYHAAKWWLLLAEIKSRIITESR